MIRAALDFLKKEKSYVILFVLLCGTYIFLIRNFSVSDRESPQAAQALEQLQKSEDKLTSHMQDTAAIEKYLKEHPDTAAILVGVLFAAAGLYSFGLFADFALLLNRSWRKKLAVPYQGGDQTDWQLAMLFKAIVLFMAFSLGIQTILFLIHLFFRLFPENFLLLLQTTLVDIFCIYVLIYLVRRYGGRPADLGLRVPSKAALREVGVGFLGYVSVFPVFTTVLFFLVVMAHLLSYEPPAHPLVNIILEEEQRSPWIITYSVVLATIIAPMLEEVFFRGFCYSIFRKKWGKGWAMVLSSVFFAAIHNNLFAFWPIFVLGMGLSYVYEKRGTLIAPIALHLAHNTIFLSYFFLAKKVLTMNV